MKRWLITGVLIIVTAGPALAERRVALVMAADDYKTIRPLDNAVSDAQSIEKSLEKLGFEVSLETNRDLRRMRRALDDFREDAAGADVALVFFAGHGVEIEGENRLLPTDADAEGIEELKDTSLPLEEVRETVNSVAKVGLIMLDACRNDPFGAGDGSGRGAKSLTVRETPLVKPGLGRLGRAENILYTFSAAPGATAADGSGENSPFTTALTKYLATDGLEIRSVLTLVQQEVYDQSHGKQLPYVENGLPKLFFASASTTQLPERERLLLAMADVTPDLRTEVENLAREKDIPLAPLYGALISSDAKALSVDDRKRKLNEAATAFVNVRTQMRTMSSADPAVAGLRQEADRQLALGAFDTARSKLDEAAKIDANSRDALKANFVERTASEASTHLISGGASRADLKYDLAIASYRKAASLFDEIDGDTLAPQQREQQLQSLETLGDLFLTVGNLAEGRAAFERQQAVASSLLRTEPSNLLWLANLAASTLKLGDVQRDQGDSSSALISYEHALETRKAIAAADPQKPQAMGLEAAAYLQLGALHKLQGNKDQALTAYAAALEITQLLVAAHPDDDMLESTLARSHRSIGEIEQDAKRFPEARASFEENLAIAKKLAETGPDNVSSAVDLATAYDMLGYIQFLQIDRSKYVESAGQDALASFGQSTAITERLIAADPKNTALQRALAGTLEKIGETTFWADSNITSEDAEKSLAAYKQANAIREHLVAADPTNKLWVADMATSYEKMATWYEFQPDDITAIGFSKKAHEQVLKLASLDPRNVAWQRNATLYHAKISESYIQIKDYKAALDYETAGLEYAVKVARANQDKPIYFHDVVTFNERMARIFFVQKDFKAYWAQNDQRLEQARRNVKRFPAEPVALYDLNDACIVVADSYTTNFPDDALELYKEAEASAQKAASLEPGNPDFAYAIYNSRLKTGYLLEQRGDTAGAVAAYESALDSIDKAIELKPGEVAYTASRDHANARIDGIRGRANQSSP